MTFELSIPPANGKAGTIYTDRLLQWDHDRHNALCLKHFGNKGQYWADREPSRIEAFLRDWTECSGLVLLRITQQCHFGNGFPIWQFDFLQPDGAE